MAALKKSAVAAIALVAAVTALGAWDSTRQCTEAGGVRREPLRAMLDDLDYGFRECELEGFGTHPDYRWPSAFVAMFCATHKGCTPETMVTRLEFAYQQEA